MLPEALHTKQSINSQREPSYSCNIPTAEIIFVWILAHQETRTEQTPLHLYITQ